jgi:hypothetical protein
MSRQMPRPTKPTTSARIPQHEGALRSIAMRTYEFSCRFRRTDLFNGHGPCRSSCFPRFSIESSVSSAPSREEGLPGFKLMPLVRPYRKARAWVNTPRNLQPPGGNSRKSHVGRTLVALTTSSKAAVPASPLEDRSIDQRLLQILERQIKTKPMAPLSLSSGKEYYAIVRPATLTIARLSSHDGSGSFEADSLRNNAVTFFAWHDFTIST